MIDEKLLMDYIREKIRTLEDMEDSYITGHNDALYRVEKLIEKMPKSDPIIIRPDNEGLRNKLRDLEFERDFYRRHFEDLYLRKVEG